MMQKVKVKIKKKKEKGKSRNFGGFSFIEVMLSLAVLSLGIITVLSLITSGMRAAFDSRDQLIASMLTQEGAEIVQNIRDNNWAASRKAFDSNYFPSSDSINCRVDYTSATVLLCGQSVDQLKLKFDATNQLNYQYASGAGTKFSRKIDLNFSGSPVDELAVVSMVIWGDSFPSVADCDVNHKCTYSTLTLADWN